MIIAQVIVWLLTSYALLGLLFASYLVTRGVRRVDSSAQQSTWGFRVMIVPGVIALWPLLLLRLMRGVQHPLIEKNAHRKAVR